MSANIWIVLLPLIAVLFTSFCAFDTLVKRLHDQYPDEWDRVGRPYGFFWRPKSRTLRWMSSGFAMQKLAFVWLFSTPEWMKQEQWSLRRLRFFRITVLIWNVGGLAFAILLYMTERS
jgi:hypothetical protein